MIKDENRNLSDRVQDLTDALNNAKRIIGDHENKRKQIEDNVKFNSIIYEI